MEFSLDPKVPSDAVVKAILASVHLRVDPDREKCVSATTHTPSWALWTLIGSLTASVVGGIALLKAFGSGNQLTGGGKRGSTEGEKPFDNEIGIEPNAPGSQPPPSSFVPKDQGGGVGGGTDHDSSSAPGDNDDSDFETPNPKKRKETAYVDKDGVNWIEHHSKEHGCNYYERVGGDDYLVTWKKPEFAHILRKATIAETQKSPPPSGSPPLDCKRRSPLQTRKLLFGNKK
jgi:hypothetical protein